MGRKEMPGNRMPAFLNDGIITNSITSSWPQSQYILEELYTTDGKLYSRWITG